MAERECDSHGGHSVTPTGHNEGNAMNEYTLEKIRHDAAMDAAADAHIRNGESWCWQCGWDMRSDSDLIPLAVGWEETCRECAIEQGATECAYCGDWDHECDGAYAVIGWVCHYCTVNRPEAMV